jgi:hypothetical protein
VSDTPRTDAAELEANIGVTHFDHKDLSAAYHFTRQLERELTAANDRIKRLEEAGDALANNHNPFTFIDWHKAKEAKP